LPAMGALILAAGKSARFGAPKVLQVYRGVPFLARITPFLRNAGVEEITLVLGHEAEKLMPRIPQTENVRFVVNKKYEDGQFSSLQAGILSLDFEVSGVLMCLIDQPHLQQATYAVIVKRALALPEKIILPRYKSRGGHPVYLPRWIFSEITAQLSTATLRDLFSRFQEQIVRVDVDDPGIREDIDTPEDLRRLEIWLPEERGD